MKICTNCKKTVAYSGKKPVVYDGEKKLEFKPFCWHCETDLSKNPPNTVKQK